MLNERKITDVNGKWFFIQNIKKWLQIEAQFFYSAEAYIAGLMTLYLSPLRCRADSSYTCRNFPGFFFARNS
jgi:hypothetical protein